MEARAARRLAALVGATAVVLSGTPAVASAAVDRAEAKRKALTALGVREDRRAVRVFALRATVAPGTRISESGPAPAGSGGVRRRDPATDVELVPAAPVMRTPAEPVWLFFADRGPHQAFEHPGRVALVGARSGRVRLSRTLRWVPLIDGRLPAFFASSSAYEGKRFQVYNRRWPLAAVSSAGAAPAKATPQQLSAGATAGERRTADALAAERSCALRVSDTLGDFYDFGRTDWTRAGLGLFFKRLGAMNPGFITERYTLGRGLSPAATAQRMIDRRGCRDLLLYAAGGAARSGEAGVVIGLQARSDGSLRRQVLTASAVKRLVRANRDVTFKLIFDAPFAGRIARSLRAEANVALLLTSGGPTESSFSYLPEVTGPSGVIRNTGNPAHLLEFTNRLINGLNRFTATPAEVESAVARHPASFMAWMLARAVDLGGSPFGDHLLNPVIIGPDTSPPSVGAPARVNQAPVLGGVSGVLAYAEDQAATPIAPTLTVTDSDSPTLAGAAVAISAAYENGEDVLGFTDQNGITGTWVPSLGAMVLTGQATVARYQTALRSVTYRNTSQNPVTTQRTVIFRADDGEPVNHLGNQVSRGIGITRANDAPALTPVAAGAFTENAPAGSAVDAGLLVSDPDSAELQSATMAITGSFDSAADALAFADTASITGSYDPGSGVLTLSGTATVADYRAALRGVTFRTTSDDPGTSRTVTARATDAEGDEGAPAALPIAVTPSNDAPTVDASAGTAGYIENGTGTAVDPGLTVADPDSPGFSGATVAIAGGFASATDVLAFTDQDGIHGDYDGSTGVLTLSGTASREDYRDALRSVAFRATGDDPSTATRTVDFRVRDDASEPSNVDTRDVSVTAADDAPTITPVTAGAFAENAPAGSPVDSGLILSDADSANLQSATMAITGGFDSAEDTLEFADTATVTGGYDSGTGVMTLTGPATVAAFETAMRTVTFSTTSDDPGTSRTVTARAADSSGTGSAAAALPIAITPSNDAPAVDASGGTAAYTEDDPTGVLVDPGVTVTDVDDTQLDGATLQITTNRDSATDVLTFSDQNGISADSWTPATGTLVLTGTATKADYQTALRSVRFRATGDAPTGLTRTVAFEVHDGDAAGTSDSRDVTVTPVNDAPAVDTSDGNASWSEAAAAVAVDPGITVGDADDANLQSAAVAITTGRDGDDELTFPDDPALTESFSQSTGRLTVTGDASVATYQAFLRAVRFSNAGATPGGADRTVEFEVGDGAASSPAADHTRVVKVTETNSKPEVTASGGAAAFVEDAGAVKVDGGVTVADGDTTELTRATVRITANYDDANDVLTFADQSGITGSWNATTGTMTLTGTATVAEYEAALRDVRFSNGDDTPSTGPRTLSLQVDDGASVNNLSDVAERTLTVTAANDAPVVTTTPGDSSFTEDQTGGTVVDAGVTVADPDDTGLSSATVTIGSGYAAGEDVLEFADTTEIEGDYLAGVLTLTPQASQAPTVAQFEAALRTVTYRNTSQSPSTAPRTLQLRAGDGSDTSSAATKTVTVGGDNDAPALTQPDAALTYTEDSPSEDHQAAVAPNLTVTDVDDGDLQGATVEITANLQSGHDELLFTDQNGITGSGAGTGTLTLSGSASVADYQAALRSVRFRNTHENPDQSARTVSFQVSDGHTGEDPLSAAATRAVDVVRTNDAPIADDETFAGASRAVGNTSLVVAASGPAPDPAGPQKTTTGDILAGDTDADHPASALSVVAGTFPTDDGGSVVIQADGDFTFHPGTGTSCSDHSDFFDYAVTDGSATGTGRVTIGIQDCVWYVDDSAAVPPAGTAGSSHTPLSSLSAVNGAGDADAAGDRIFLYDGTYAGGLALEDSQRLQTEKHGLSVGDGAAGTVTIEAPDGTGSTLRGGLVLAAGNDVQGLDLGTTGSASVFALSGASVGAATVNTSTPGAIDNPAGGAVNISGGTLDMRFSAVSSTGSGSDGIRLANTTGTFVGSGGSILNAAEQAVDISGNDSGDDVGFAYDGTIGDNAGPGAVISIADQTGGTKDFNGAVSSSGAGISLQSSSASTLTRFDGGLTLSTGTGSGLFASNGGRLAVTDPVGAANNTITTTTAAALSLAATGIHAEGLTFERISSNGATSGIVLDGTGDATSGRLSVTGNGAANSGGVIQSSGGPGVNLTGVGGGVSLTRMAIQNGGDDGIRGSAVHGLTLADSAVTNNGNAVTEHGLDLTGLTGTVALHTSSVGGSADHNVAVVNDSGSLNMTVTNGTYANTSSSTGNDGIMLEGTGTGSMTLAVNGSSFSNNRGDHIQVTNDGSTSVTQNVTIANTQMSTTPLGSASILGGGITISPGSAANVTATITGNSIQNAVSNAIRVDTTSDTTATVNATITGNTIGTAGTGRSGSFSANGLQLIANGGSRVNALVTGNTIRRYTNSKGIQISQGDGVNATMNATLRGNTLAEPDNALGGAGGIGVRAGLSSAAGDAGTMCLDVGGAGGFANALTGAGTNLVGTGTETEDIFVWQRFGARIQFPGLGATTTDAAVMSYLQGRNSGGATPTVYAEQTAPGSFQNKPTGCETP